MQYLVTWLGETHLAGISYLDLVTALATGLASYGLMLLALRVLGGRLSAVARRTRTTMDDVVVGVLASTNRWLLLAAALLIGAGTVDFGTRWNDRLDQVWFVALALQLALWLNRAVDGAVRAYEARNGRAGAQPSASATLLAWFLRTLLWVVILLAILSNLGVNITAFVASLGVGGIALALAVQNILGDLFASLSIAVDKPFEVGDFIVSDAGMGTVEYVGLKTTRIRSLGGEQIVVGNTDLLKQPVKNFGRMQERRVVFRFGVTYDTPVPQVEAIPQVVRQLVESDPLLRFDRAHFHGFGDSSLDFEVVYYVLDPGYNIYMDAQQRLNVGLLRIFAERGIQFAFPTRTLHIAAAGAATAEIFAAPAAASGAPAAASAAPAPAGRATA